MKVICIRDFVVDKNDVKISTYIKLGKIYDALEIGEDYYSILLDDKWFLYNKEMFRLLSEVRNEKLEKLLCQ